MKNKEPKPAPERDVVVNPRPGVGDVDTPAGPDHVHPMPKDVDLDD